MKEKEEKKVEKRKKRGEGREGGEGIKLGEGDLADGGIINYRNNRMR